MGSIGSLSTIFRAYKQKINMEISLKMHFKSEGTKINSFSIPKQQKTHISQEHAHTTLQVKPHGELQKVSPNIRKPEPHQNVCLGYKILNTK